MEKLVLVIHVLAALGVIGLVLLQHGKGADMGKAHKPQHQHFPMMIDLLYTPLKAACLRLSCHAFSNWQRLVFDAC